MPNQPKCNTRVNQSGKQIYIFYKEEPIFLSIPIPIINEYKLRLRIKKIKRSIVYSFRELRSNCIVSIRLKSTISKTHYDHFVSTTRQ